MKRLKGLGLIFAGMWAMAYHLNPQALGTHERAAVGFAIFSGIITAGIALLLPNRNDH